MGKNCFKKLGKVKILDFIKSVDEEAFNCQTIAMEDSNSNYIIRFMGDPTTIDIYKEFRFGNTDCYRLDLNERPEKAFTSFRKEWAEYLDRYLGIDKEFVEDQIANKQNELLKVYNDYLTKKGEICRSIRKLELIETVDCGEAPSKLGTQSLNCSEVLQYLYNGELEDKEMDTNN